MGYFWCNALAPLRKHPRVRDLRICGNIAAVELELPGGYLAPVGRQLQEKCLENDVLLRPLGSVLYAMPPYCTSDASLEKIANAMGHAVESLA
jgi:adenosylmethionine-8-amino-7-oxononanoate aminotransferase